MADATAAEAKQSAGENDRAREDLSGYQIVLDLLVAKHFGYPKAPGLLEHGDDLKLDNRALFMQSLEDLEELALVERVESLARQPDRRFFHWEIEFPEVFFAFADANERHLKLYDPENQPIVACSQADWDLAARIMASGRLGRLGEFCTAYQGEVNETTDGAKGNISDDERDGPMILRGSNICLYVLRPASLGEAIYLRQANYLKDKRPGAKAWHHQHRRVGLQESCPQNNFRRVIASLIPKGEFCNHLVNYVPEPECRYPLPVLLALLNSKFIDWYFRLGSTNAHVSHYQLYNLPAPKSADGGTDSAAISNFESAIARGDVAAAFGIIEPMLETSPFPVSVMTAMISLVERIIAIERDRGDIARTERSSLALAAQPLQELLDRIIFRIAGLSSDESGALEDRLCQML